MPALESPATRHTPDARAPARRSSDAGLKLLAQVAAVALAFFVVAGWLESSLTRILQPSEAELDWVSDAVESLALGVATYLWLHLRATRRELTARERFEVVHFATGGVLFPLPLMIDVPAIERDMPELKRRLEEAEEEARKDPALRACGAYAVFRKK